MILKTRSGHEFSIDDKDIDAIAGITWYSHAVGRTMYVQGVTNGKTIMLHRVIMNAQNGQMIDHIDGNGMNNTRANLRFCTCADNQHNSRKIDRARLSSSYKGVSFSRGKWRALLRLNKKYVHVGTFQTETEAAIAYNAKATELYGEFARLNVIEERVS